MDNFPFSQFNLFFFLQFQKFEDVVERPPLYRNRPSPAFCDGKLEIRKGPLREGLPKTNLYIKIKTFAIYGVGGDAFFKYCLSLMFPEFLF